MHFKNYISYLFLAFLFASCANKAAGPTGGPKDSIPPRILKSSPENGVLNFKKKELTIEFDEIIQVQKVSENVVVSPPQVKEPDIKAIGKKLTVEFNEDLLDNTTYAISFGNAIVDNNENNPLPDYRFAFSTGNDIDTLKISGTVINAEDLNPVSGITVGIYENVDDTVFSKKPFRSIAKTNAEGKFTIQNVKSGTYKLFALADDNKDYSFQLGEGLAMHDTLVTPSVSVSEKQDTVWKDSVTVDSIRTSKIIKFSPENVTLRLFKESKKRQYFIKGERKDAYSFNLFFNTKLERLPQITPLNFNWDGKYMVQKSNNLDSLTYWLTDSTVWKTDTLQMAMTYPMTDSLSNLVPQTDTLTLAVRKLKINTKAKKSKIKEKVEDYKFTQNIASTFEINSPIVIKFEAPLDSVDLSRIVLSQKVDTVYKPLIYNWQQTDSTRTKFTISHSWTESESYQLEIDSACIKSIYGKVNNPYKSTFKIRPLEEYASLNLSITPFNSKVILQLLDTKDAVIASQPAIEVGTFFEYLKPGDYYLRMFVDENGNGLWDNGELSPRKQPEIVNYNPKKLSLLANWEFEETWNLDNTPLLLQKPTELKTDISKKAAKPN